MTGKIFLKLIAGVFGLLLLALLAVDYFATDVAQESYKENLKNQLAGKCRLMALSLPAPGAPRCSKRSLVVLAPTAVKAPPSVCNSSM